MAGFITFGPAAVVLAVLDSSAASTTAVGPEVIKPVDKIKIWLKYCDLCVFLQLMLNVLDLNPKLDFEFWYKYTYLMFRVHSN